MKITLTEAEISAILTTYIASKVPGQYVCDFDTRSYTLTATIETFEVSDAQ
jgi:hypothetical protein